MSTQLAPCPKRRPRLSGLLVGLSLTLTLCAALPPERARATERQHTVRGGQTMAGVARRYGVTVWSLAAANALKPDQQLREGQILSVPDKGAVYVNEGQTLWSVARRHRVSVDDLARCNNLKLSSNLRPGMRLMLPGHSASKAGGPSLGGRDWGTPKRPGHVAMYRVATQKSLTLAMTDVRGRVRPGVAETMARFLRPRDSTKTKAPNKRLLSLLAQTSDHFGGRKLHVISGYRLAQNYTNHESRHVHGAAVDFRIEGVPNRVLCDYLRHFDDVGVGFYPNSSFIHLDVRSKNAYWIDMSGPGQKPHYLRRAERNGYDEAVRESKETPIDQLVEDALEELHHDEPEETEADDE